MSQPKSNEGLIEEFELEATCAGVLLSGWKDKLLTILAQKDAEVVEAYKKGYVDGELAYAQRLAMHFTPPPKE